MLQQLAEFRTRLPACQSTSGLPRQQISHHITITADRHAMLEGQHRLKACCMYQRKPLFLVLVRHRFCWLVWASPTIGADFAQGQKLADVSVQHGMNMSQRQWRNSRDAPMWHGTQTGSTAALFRQDSCQPFEVNPENAIRSLVACMTPSPLKQQKLLLLL